MIPIECYAHILHRVGENFGDERTLCEQLRKTYVAFFKNSHQRLSEWRDHAGVGIPSHNRIRWSSDYLLETFLEDHFAQMQEFVATINGMLF